MSSTVVTLLQCPTVSPATKDGVATTSHTTFSPVQEPDTFSLVMPADLRGRMSEEEFGQVVATLNALSAPARRTISEHRVAKRTVAGASAILAVPTIGISLLGLLAIPFLEKKQKSAALASVTSVSTYLDEVNKALFLERGVQWRLAVRPGLNLGMDCPMSAVYAPLIIESDLSPTPASSDIDSVAGLATLRTIQPLFPSPVVKASPPATATPTPDTKTTTDSSQPAPEPSAPTPTETKPSPE